jgi:tetratricopeptide (TPR) repeat protein
MESLEQVLLLARLGRFGEALRKLEDANAATFGTRQAEVLRAALLEKVGYSEQALELATRLLKSKHLTKSQRSECETVLGRLLFDRGDTEGGLARFRRAALLAQEAGDLHALFAANIQLLVILSDRFGPAAGSAVLADVRQIATKLGDPEITARLHLFVAQIEAKRGLLENARRHTALARRILKGSPNAYLEAFTGNLDLAIAVLCSEFDVAKECGHRAAELAELSGVAKIRRAVLGNMGNLFCEIGEFDRATECFERALDAPHVDGALTWGLLDSLARVHLIKERFDACGKALDRIESAFNVEQDRLSYELRYATLTRIALLGRQGQRHEALSQINSVLRLTECAGDSLLQRRAKLTKAELLQTLGDLPSSMTLMADVVPGLVGVSVELYAHSEQILACALTSRGDQGGTFHHDRASRIYRAIGSVPKQMELAVSWNEARKAKSPEDAVRNFDDKKIAEDSQLQGARVTLHGLAFAFTHATRPELIASELIGIMTAAGCTYTARATSQTEGGSEEIIAESVSEESYPESSERRMSVGFRNDREVRLHFRPKPGIESVASINALTLLLESLARAEREERATLWPIEELPDDARSVISGRMRELMTDARKIARTKVNVLITGEISRQPHLLNRSHLKATADRPAPQLGRMASPSFARRAA